MFNTAGEGRRLTVDYRRRRPHSLPNQRAGRAIAIVCVVTTYLALLTGCATAPRASLPEVEDYLVAGQSVYFSVNVATNRELVAYVVAALGVEADVIIDRIDLFAGSLNDSPSDDTVSPAMLGFSGVALGQFPQGTTRFALSRQREFKRSVAETEHGRLIYHRQVGSSLEVAVPRSGIVLVSTNSVAGLVRATSAIVDRSGAAVAAPDRPDPEVVESLRSVRGRANDGRLLDDSPDIVIVLPDPASLFTSRLGLSIPRFPILRLSLAVNVHTTPEDAGAEDAVVDDPGTGSGVGEPTPPAVYLELTGEFEFNTETQAALFGRLGRVFILGFVRALGLEASKLRDPAGPTVQIATEGTTLRFQGVTMTPDDLVGLAIRLMGQEQ